MLEYNKANSYNYSTFFQILFVQNKLFMCLHDKIHLKEIDTRVVKACKVHVDYYGNGSIWKNFHQIALF